MLVAGIDFTAVEVAEGVERGVVREEDDVGLGRIWSETRVFEDSTVEDEF